MDMFGKKNSKNVKTHSGKSFKKINKKKKKKKKLFLDIKALFPTIILNMLLMFWYLLFVLEK
jgi:hypothetical protein